MPIVRSHHQFDDYFTRVPNDWVRDDRLSLKAIGLLVQLLSHAPGWKVSVASLAKANSCGLDAIRSAIRELEQAGYLRRRQERIDTRFAEAIWETCEPSSAFPITAFPSPENPTPKKNNEKKTKIKNVYADSAFEIFWLTYPRKVGRQAAYRAFLNALETATADLINDGANRFASDPNLPPKQYVPYPATWLNRHGWLDEALPEREIPKEELAERELIARREADRRQAEKLRQMDAETRANAAPMPICKHGLKLPLCLPCCRELAENGEQ